jgi:hypothetical protein
VYFGYTGQRTADVAEGIRVDDVRWLLTSVGRLTDAQLRVALEASGADAKETDQFCRALRARIEQLERACAATPVAGAAAAHPVSA